MIFSLVPNHKALNPKLAMNNCGIEYKKEKRKKKSTNNRRKKKKMFEWADELLWTSKNPKVMKKCLKFITLFKLIQL